MLNAVLSFKSRVIPFIKKYHEMCCPLMVPMDQIWRSGSRTVYLTVINEIKSKFRMNACLICESHKSKDYQVR